MLMREENYTQCKLRKDNTYQTSWIPSNFAQVGKVVKLRDEETGIWTDGWIVEATYSSRTWKEVNVASQLHKHQRKASDI